jgi:hypothetical protein
MVSGSLQGFLNRYMLIAVTGYLLALLATGLAF